MRHFFVINPVAGHSDPLALLTRPIEAAFTRIEEPYEIYVTTGQGDATRFVKDCCARYSQPLCFYSCGGDGTLNEVVCGLIGQPHATLGVIPCGSGNDFCKVLGDDLDFFDISRQVEGEEFAVDVVRINSHYCINVASIGLDADVGANMVRFKSLPMVSGKGAYNFSLVYSLLHKIGHPLTVTLDDDPAFTRQLLLMVVGNGSFYGGQYHCTPTAQIDDGLLDVCMVDKISRLKILPLINCYKEGLHVSDKRFAPIVTYRQCRRVTVEAPSPVSICVDGEMLLSDRFEFEILPRALRLRLPLSSQDRFSDRVRDLCVTGR